jgi:hypothetical protein
LSAHRQANGEANRDVNQQVYSRATAVSTSRGDMEALLVGSMSWGEEPAVPLVLSVLGLRVKGVERLVFPCIAEQKRSDTW